MLPHPRLQIRRHAGVERAVSTTGHDVGRDERPMRRHAHNLDDTLPFVILRAAKRNRGTQRRAKARPCHGRGLPASCGGKISPDGAARSPDLRREDAACRRMTKCASGYRFNQCIRDSRRNQRWAVHQRQTVSNEPDRQVSENCFVGMAPNQVPAFVQP